MQTLVKGLGVEQGGRRRARHRPDGRLRVRRAVPGRKSDKLVLMDAFLPGVEAGKRSTTIRRSGTSGSRGRPGSARRGRERTYFEHFWNDFAADKTWSIPEADRQAYTAAYARPGRMRAAWAYFVSFQQAAKDFARLSQTKLTMPVLSIGGENANGEALRQQVKLVATNASIGDAAEHRPLDHGGEPAGNDGRADALLESRGGVGHALRRVG